MLDNLHKLALETIDLGKQAIIFVPSRASAEKTAEDISKLTPFQYPEFNQYLRHYWLKFVCNVIFCCF